MLSSAVETRTEGCDVDETLESVGGRWVLRMERRLGHPPEKVWRALTDPAELSGWFPARMRMNLELGAAIRFTFDDDPGPGGSGTITELDPPRVFAFTWDGELLRWELRPAGAGCLLLFTHTFDDRPGAASFTAGWVACLDALDQVLAGRPVDVPDEYAEQHERYVERFGLGEGTVLDAADGWTVRFVRQFPHPQEQVWAVLTEAAAPAPGEPAPVPATNGYVAAGPVTAVEPGTVLEYTWRDGEPDGEAGRVRWELSEGPGGGRVVLTQTVPARLAEHLPTALAAWHTQLELLAKHLGGADVCPWPEERTRELRHHYAGLVSGS
jgi:uncharacterized protein YndB with AHSA1/START domain